MPDQSTQSHDPDPESVEIATLLHERNLIVLDRLVLGYATKLTKRLKRTFYLKWNMQLSDQDIEDIIYETFEQVYKEGARYDPAKSKIETWLTRKANYRAKTWIRSRYGITHSLLDNLEETLIVETEITSDNDTPTPSPRMETLLQQLPKRRATVLRLFYYEYESPSNIAHRLGITENTVRVHLFHGLRDLRQLIERQQHHD